MPITAPVNGTAKAWVNFNGTGVVAIRASFNVASITDNGTGDYTVNFTTPMIDANYGVTVTGGAWTGAYNVTQVNDTTTPYLTSSIRIASVAQSAGTPTAYDSPYVNLAVFR